MQRTIVKYDARQDAAERWSAWSFRFTELSGLKAVVCEEKRLVLLGSERWVGREDQAMAEAVAYLDLGLQSIEDVTVDQVRQVEWLAEMRMHL